MSFPAKNAGLEVVSGFSKKAQSIFFFIGRLYVCSPNCRTSRKRVFSNWCQSRRPFAGAHADSANSGRVVGHSETISALRLLL